MLAIVMRINLKFILIAPFLLVLVLGACSEEPANPIRVGTNSWPGYEPAYLAEELDYFAAPKVQITRFNSATETIRAFRNGSIEIAALTLDEVMQMISDGIRLTIFLVADISHGGDVIIGGPHMTAVSDLKGRTVAVESTSLGAYVLARALEVNNLSADDIEPVHMTVDESEQAFLSGKVDAVVTFDPYRTRLLRKGANEIFTSREIPNEIVDVLVVRKEYADANPDKLKMFSKAWFQAVDFIEQQPDKAAAMIGQNHDLNPTEALASYEGLVLPGAGKNAELLAGEEPGSLYYTAKKLLSVMVGQGILDHSPRMDGVISDHYVQ